MKRSGLLLTIFFSSIFLTAFGQTGFYRNLFGDNNTNVNTTTKLSSLKPMSNGRHFVGGAQRVYADYFSFILYDNNFSSIWTASYQSSTGGPDDRCDNAVELENGTIVSHCVYDGIHLFVGHDPNGNLIFSRYYGTTVGVDYPSVTLVESSENDTCYVALFLECAVNHGLMKFDKNGNVLWSYENSTNNDYKAFFILENAVNSGYISGGVNSVTPMTDSSQRYGYLIVSNNDGSFNKGKKYAHSTDQYNVTHIKRILTAQNGTYFANFAFGNSYNGPQVYNPNKTIAQLDSNLSVLHEWELSVPDTNQRIDIENLAETSDGKILISGVIRNDVSSPVTQYFLMKFNPNTPGGEIEWCKKFNSFNNSQSWLPTTSNNALYSSEIDNQILFSYNAHLDGSCVSSIDQNGDGHCLSSDRIMNHSEINEIIEVDYITTPLAHPVQPFDVPLTPYSAELKDTVYCSMDLAELDENEFQTEILEIKQMGAKHFFRNLSDTNLDFVVYTMSGKVVLRKELQVSEQFNVELEMNQMYLFKAYSAEGTQVGRILSIP